MSLAEIQGAVANLTDKERAELAAWILDRLPEHDHDDAIAETIAEAERREEEMSKGITKPLSEAESWSSVDRERA